MLSLIVVSTSQLEYHKYTQRYQLNIKNIGDIYPFIQQQMTFHQSIMRQISASASSVPPQFNRYSAILSSALIIIRYSQREKPLHLPCSFFSQSPLIGFLQLPLLPPLLLIRPRKRKNLPPFKSPFHLTTNPIFPQNKTFIGTATLVLLARSGVGV